MNLFVKQKYSYRCREQVYDYQEEKGSGMDGEIGIDTYILLRMKQKTNKNLLYSTGDSALRWPK